MKKRHLIWIIPAAFFIGLYIGATIGFYSMAAVGDMIEDMDECSMPAVTYAIENNPDCKILITGFMAQCMEDLEG